jgi:peroxiredoxin
MKKLLAFIVAVALASSAFADDYLRSVKDFTLTDQNGKVHSFSDYKDTQYLVMFVNGVGCPISRLAVLDYLAVRNHFLDEDKIEFLIFNSSIQDSLSRIKEEAETFKIPLPILKDADQSLAKELGVERTADVFVIDTRSGVVVYRGPVNDKFGYETQRSGPVTDYLTDSLYLVLSGVPINISNIPESKGCLVGIF